MEFKLPYVQAMREKAPRMFMEMRRAGTLDQHLQDKSLEAHRMLTEMLARAPKDQYGDPTMQARREAEETVRATLIEFPAEETKRESRQQPPDALGTSEGA